MDKLEQDKTFFVSWCIEQYKVHKSLNGQKALELLDRYHVLEYLASHYEVLHTQSRQWIMEEIDEMLEEKIKEDAVC